MNKSISKRQSNTIIFTAIIFIVLTLLVIIHSKTFQTIDNQIQSYLRLPMSPKLTHILLTITNLMGVSDSMIISIILVLLLAVTKHFNSAAFLMVNGLLLSYPINVGIKFLVNRPRPSLPHLAVVNSSSFPSGHSMVSIMVGGSLIFVLNRIISHQTTKFIVDCLICGFILLIGYSRIYLGVHYPSDVLAGFCLGLLIINITNVFFKRWNLL